MMSTHLDRVLADVRAAGLDALLVSTPANTYYVCGFRAITYSRPALVVVGEQPVLIIPELEETHARATSGIPTIRTYADTGLGGSGGKSTLQVAVDHCVDAMRESGLRGRRIGFEPGGFSVDGYAYLSEAWGNPFVPTRGLVEARRMVKDAHELELVRTGAALAEVGMRFEVDASVPGKTEIEIMARGDAAMLLEGARRHPEYHITAGARPAASSKRRGMVAPSSTAPVTASASISMNCHSSRRAMTHRYGPGWLCPSSRGSTSTARVASVTRIPLSSPARDAKC